MKISEGRLRHIASQFAISGEVLSIEPYGNGHINDTFHLKTCMDDVQKRYILQRMNGDIFENRDELMENVQKVSNHLAQKVKAQGGDPERETLQIVLTKNGCTYYKEETGEGWRVYPFIEGTTSYDNVDDLEKFRQSGYAFGNFQYLLKDFPAEQLHETIANFHNTPDRLAKFKYAVEQDTAGRAHEVWQEIAFIMAREKDCYFFHNLLAEGEIPLRVTHNDTKLNNVLFSVDTDEAICVIDLDTVMPGAAAYDFGDTIRTGASTGAEDEPDLDKIHCDMELFEVYLDGFLEGCRGSLTATEVETLPMGAKIITLEQMIRFLTDYLEGDIYYKTHRPGQNLDRARTQMKLVADMEAKWSIMSGIAEKHL